MEIVKILEKDIVKNINMINFIENYPVNKVESIGDSILIRGKSDHNWIYISSNKEAEFKYLLEKCNSDKYFAIMEDWMVPFIGDIEWKLSCMKLYYPVDKGIDTYNNVSDLSLDDAEYIYNNSKYKEFTSIEYIKERIKNGIGLGVYENNQLVAWILTHDDGAIGFLNVLKEHRSKGYAKSLTVAMITRLREINKLPFIHIEEDNIKSMSLAMKLGFVKDRKIHWIKRK